MLHKRFAVKLLTTFDAHFSVVWEAFSNIEWIKNWYKPLNFKLIEADYNVKVGERWWFILQRSDGRKFRSTGVFYFVRTYNRIVFSHSWQEYSKTEDKTQQKPFQQLNKDVLSGKFETQISLSFEKKADNKTLLHFLQTGFDSHLAHQAHYNVWNECFVNLSDFLNNSYEIETYYPSTQRSLS